MTTPSDKLVRLLNRCKGSVSLTVNEHRDYYERPTEYINRCRGDLRNIDVSKDILQQMEKHNSVVELHFYPDTPVGFYEIWHFDVEAAIDEANEIIDRDRHGTE